MLKKVFNKGQVVLPVAVRRELGIEIGDMVDVSLDEDHKGIYIKRPSSGGLVKEMAGALHEYAVGRDFPSKQQIEETMSKGMVDEDSCS